MEALTRLVSESLARYGLDRPVDYRRLQWSRWFRCESLHSLLHVPSKPGIFAIAEEIMEFGAPTEPKVDTGHVGTAALGCPAEGQRVKDPEGLESWEGHDFSRAINAPSAAALAAEDSRRMLSVLQFREADDMAYILDRMLSRQNPMSARLSSGKCFVRFVVIEDEIQRSNICNALNQWLVSTGEKVSGIGTHFATSLKLTRTTDDAVGRTLLSANANTTRLSEQAQGPEIRKDATRMPGTSPHLDSGCAANIHCPQPIPSGF